MRKQGKQSILQKIRFDLGAKQFLISPLLLLRRLCHIVAISLLQPIVICAYTHNPKTSSYQSQRFFFLDSGAFWM